MVYEFRVLEGKGILILGKVHKAMMRAGFVEEAKQYMAEAMSGDYDNLLAVTMEYVEVV
jgi:hypothetical protein